MIPKDARRTEANTRWLNRHNLLAQTPQTHSRLRVKQSLGLVSLVVRDYDEALGFFVGKLGFVLIEDSFVPEQSKRWVVVAPPGASESRLLLAQASTPEQQSRIGNQTGGRVFLFLHTDDFWRDYKTYRSRGIVFVREPRQEAYGTVAVFKDLYGNLWDLLEP
jgi:catechol 2,3-dioxygenase-like lactoylglutathione lyase family enzyme